MSGQILRILIGCVVFGLLLPAYTFAQDTNGQGTGEGYQAPIFPGEVKSLSDPAVLLYMNTCGSGVNNASAALANLGLTNVTTVLGSTDFSTQLAGGPWDLVLVDTYNDGLMVSQYDALVTYFDGGGRIILFNWSAAHNNMTHALWTRAGATPLYYYTMPLPVYAWLVAPLFSSPNAVPNLAVLTDPCNTDGQRLQVGTGTAHGGYTASSTAGEAALTVSADGRFVVNGFCPQVISSDLDSDGKNDMVELYENEITLVLNTISCQPAIPGNPLPADGAINVPLDTDLSWTSSYGSIVEDFEDGNLSEYVLDVSGDRVASGAAAHDGSYGIAGTGVGVTGWDYRNDAQVAVSQGNTISYWAKLPSTGRVYCGFGATSAGTYSIVMAPNSSEFMLQLNPAYADFVEFATVPQTWVLNQWYRLEVEWGLGGNITGRLYDADGTTLLNTVTGVDSTYTSGGIAFRGFPQFYVDTVLRTGAARASLAASDGVWQPAIVPDISEAIGWDEANGGYVYGIESLDDALPADAKGDLVENPTDSGQFPLALAPAAQRVVNPGCGGTIIGFDDIDASGGNVAWTGDRYVGQGVTFSTIPGSTLMASNYGTSDTPPNWVYGTSGYGASDPVIADLDVPASCVSLYVYDSEAPGANFTINVYNSLGAVLQSLVTNVDSQRYAFSYPDIRRVEFIPSSDWEGMDSFNFVTQSATCYPLGGKGETWSGNPRLRANVLTVDAPQTLSEIRMELSFTGTTNLYFYVLESSAQGGPYTVALEQMVSTTGTGLGMYSSGALSHVLQPGTYYAIGAAWITPSISYYRNPATFPAAWDLGMLHGYLSADTAPPYTTSIGTVYTIGVYSMELCFGGAACDVTYDVYFGTTNPPLTLVCSGGTAANCDPGALAPGTTYYWRVVANNCCGSTLGPVWSFTTAGQSSVTHYASTDVPRAITDYSATVSVLPIFDIGIIADLDVNLNITHTFDGDLRAYLESPGGTQVELFRYVGGGDNNFTGTTFDDEAGLSITAGTPPFSGSFRPSGFLAAFDGETGFGVWTLVIYDDAGGDAGTLNSWSLDIDYVDSGFSSLDVPKPIADLSTVTSTLEVTQSVIITDVNAVLNLTHTCDADLIVTLTSPLGTTVELCSNVGGGGDNFADTVFDDEAVLSVVSGTAPFAGSYRPEGSLAAFDGQNAQGTWTLTVYDVVGGDSGSLNSWEINLEVTVSSPAEKWVQFGFTGVENGSSSNPYNTLQEGMDTVSILGTVKIYSGQTTETPRITKGMTLKAMRGVVRLGDF